MIGCGLRASLNCPCKLHRVIMQKITFMNRLHLVCRLYIRSFAGSVSPGAWIIQTSRSVRDQPH